MEDDFARGSMLTNYPAEDRRSTNSDVPQGQSSVQQSLESDVTDTDRNCEAARQTNQVDRLSAREGISVTGSSREAEEPDPGQTAVEASFPVPLHVSQVGVSSLRRNQHEEASTPTII